jgi:hypothetical protein
VTANRQNLEANQVMSAPLRENEELFQPGQLGVRHLLGVMTVAAIVLGASAVRLRTLRPWEVGAVAAHWTIVLSIAGGTFYYTSWRRRRDRAAAGQLLLRVLCKPMTERRRTFIKWLLTALVVIDGIFISLVVYPGATAPKLSNAGVPTVDVLGAILQGAMPQVAVWEGALWGWCLAHWLTNIYWVEFRQHGILMYAGYFPWKGMSHLGWSTIHPERLVFLQGGHVREVAINPASHAAVDEVLKGRMALGCRQR